LSVEPSTPDAAVPAPDYRLVGTVISGSQQIETLLGQGVMGKVRGAHKPQAQLERTREPAGADEGLVCDGVHASIGRVHSPP
jgi:hypothetical protein